MKEEYEKFIDTLLKVSITEKDFRRMTCAVANYVENLSLAEFTDIVSEIGAIPEKIIPSSTEEKLYSKASDVVLARCFRELGLTAKAVRGRGDSADVIAESVHGYSLVADAKTFRLSRSAKNQKDFKISNLSKWRGSDNDFAILVAPYFQYPKERSQIYFSALTENVCLFSWEHILFLLTNSLREDTGLSLENIWEAPKRLKRDTKIAFADSENNHLEYVSKMMCSRAKLTYTDFLSSLSGCRTSIVQRSDKEIESLEREIQKIKKYTKRQAIEKLIDAAKLNQRIATIEGYKESLK